MSKQILPNNRPKDNGLSPAPAIHLARQAITHLLTGEPHPATFDPADLEAAEPARSVRQLARDLPPTGVDR